jgi:hypothetical protein
MDKNIYVRSNSNEHKNSIQNKKIVGSKPNKITFDSGYDKIKLYKQAKSKKNKSKKNNKNKIKKYTEDSPNYNETKNCNTCGRAIYRLNTHLLEHINDNELCSCSNQNYDVKSYDNSSNESCNESYNVTSVPTPTCVNKYENTNEELNICENVINQIQGQTQPSSQLQVSEQKQDQEQPSIITKNVEVKSVSINDENDSQDQSGIEIFIVQLRKIIGAVLHFISCLKELDTLQNESIKLSHDTLINLYKFNENFILDTPIIFSFIVALKIYGKYIMDIENYDNVNDIIINLNKINLNQTDILNITEYYFITSKNKLN